MTKATETFRGVVFPWHCDVMGHMSVQHQMPLLDNAVHHLLGEFGSVVTTKEDGRRLGWADVEQTIRYLQELTVGDLLVLHSGIMKVGSSSLRHRTVLSRRSDGAVCTIMEGVTVRFDLDRRRSTPLSDEERAIAAQLKAPPAPEAIREK